jgi:hypothetical protein
MTPALYSFFMEERKMKRFSFMALLMLTLGGFSLVGCGGSGGGGAIEEANLVGRWTTRTISANGQTTNCPGTIVLDGITEASCNSGDFWEFKADGTYLARVAGVSEAGGWVLTGDNEITITPRNDRSYSGTVRLSNANNLTITGVDPEDGTEGTTTYTR